MNPKQEVIDYLKGENTYQITIKVGRNEGRAYTLFEEIQNDYRLYDNCVIDYPDKTDPFEIIIEGKNKKEIDSLAKEIKEEISKS